MNLGTRYLALFLLFLSFTAMRPAASITDLGLDTWVIDDSECGIVSSIVIDGENAQITAIEECLIGDCSWGWAALEHKTFGYVARFEQGGFDYELFVRVRSSDQIQVLITDVTEKQEYLLSNNLYRRQ